MGLFRQKYWSGLPFPPPGNIPESRIKLAPPVSAALVSGGFTTATWIAVAHLTLLYVIGLLSLSSTRF